MAVLAPALGRQRFDVDILAMYLVSMSVSVTSFLVASSIRPPVPVVRRHFWHFPHAPSGPRFQPLPLEIWLRIHSRVQVQGLLQHIIFSMRHTDTYFCRFLLIDTFVLVY